jgi:inosine/xanthosine triphosphatase
MDKILRIAVGTTNPAKLEAVKEILQDYLHLKHAMVTGMKADSGVSDQPKSLDETITGAMNRARGAFSDCKYSLGIESGLFPVPHTKSGYMDVCAVAIYDGKEFHLGLSSAWEFPDPAIIRLMLDEGLDMSQAINKVGLTGDPNIGSAEGAIGIVTKGRISRKEYTKQALRMALIHLDA